MAKAAIIHFAQTLAVELVGHRINVNVINPGWIDTPGERAFYTEEQIQEGVVACPGVAAGRQKIPARRSPSWPAMTPITSPVHSCELTVAMLLLVVRLIETRLVEQGDKYVKKGKFHSFLPGP
jgi:NAD(P)-dependent dehydrogenase (short-subunit alcohol dehydrogenase family)